MKTTNKILALVIALLMLAGCAAGGNGDENGKAKIGTCTVTVDCTSILLAMDDFNPAKDKFFPDNGYILEKKEVDLFEGDTVIDVLKRACEKYTCSDNCELCQKNGIVLDAEYNSAFGSHYVKGIHQIYEKDCGDMSGWTCKIGGEMPDYSNGDPLVKDGDSVEFVFVTSWE